MIFSYSDPYDDYIGSIGQLDFKIYKLVCPNKDTAYACFGDSTASASVFPNGGFPFDPDGVRLVIASASHTGNVTSAGWFPQSAVNSSNSLHSNTVVGGGALSNTSIPFASFGATGTYGARISGSHSLQASVIGNYSSQLDGDFYVQFSESGFSNFTHSYALPIRSSLMYNYTTGGGTPNPGIPQ